MILDLQKSCRDSTKFPYAPHLVSPIANILYYHGTFVLTKIPTLIHYYYLNATFYLDFISFSTVFFLIQDPIQDTITFSCLVSLLSSGLWQFLSPSLFFNILRVLRSTGHVFCWMFLNLNLMFFWLLDWGYLYQYGLRGIYTLGSNPILRYLFCCLF